MKKILAGLTLMAVLAAGGYALADDPDGRLSTARNHLQLAIAQIEAEMAQPPAVSTTTVVSTTTTTVTAPPSTVPPTTPPTTTAPPPTTPPTTTTPTQPPPAGFPTRAQALARSSVVVVSGNRSTQFRVVGPPADTTYDFRGMTSTAFPPANSISLGAETPGVRTVSIGGRVIGQQPRDASWAQVHDTIGGSGLRMDSTGFAVVYDFYAENVNDGVEIRRPDLNSPYLIDGLRCVWVRDDCIEADDELSGTIRNVVADGVNNAISLGQSVKNANAVTNIENAVFVHAPMVNDRAADGIGHQTLFKQAPAGRVNMTNVTDCMYENPISPGRIGIRPAGTWTNVTFVLGPGWVGPNPSVPAGATVSRDWQGLCVNP